MQKAMENDRTERDKYLEELDEYIDMKNKGSTNDTNKQFAL